MNKEFGSTLCDKLSHMVQEGGKVTTGGCTGEVIYKSHLVLLVLELVWMLDDLMIRGAVMYLCRDGLTIVFCHMHHDVYVIVVRFL